jgi:Xaa-Pro aminopeptidase
MYNKRWNKILKFLEDKKAHAFVVTKPANIRYLCCSHIPYTPVLTHLIIPRKGEPIGITSSLEEFRARKEAGLSDIRIFTTYDKIPSDGKNALTIIKRTLGVLKATKNYSDGSINGMKTSSDNIIERMRIKKDAIELRNIRAACRITDIGARKLINEILRPGVTEEQAANELDYALRSHRGVQGVSFETIIAAGRKHSTFSHHNNTPYKLQDGDVVICDFGISYKGYCSDVTRTHAIGSASEKMIEIFDVVHDSQKQAIKAVKPGVEYHVIDDIARKVIDEYGYARNFVHSVGHGLGLEVHEDPMGIRSETKGKMEKNHVFTIEPGVYVPRKGGVRIEDDICVTSGGCEVLSKASKWL